MLKMRSRIRRYIYISTDSVYEVCEEPSHEDPRVRTMPSAQRIRRQGRPIVRRTLMEVQSWSVSTFNLLAISSIFLGTSLNLKKSKKN